MEFSGASPGSPAENVKPKKGRTRYSHYDAEVGVVTALFCVTSRRKLLALPPRARVHQRTIGDAMKIDE